MTAHDYHKCCYRHTDILEEEITRLRVDVQYARDNTKAVSEQRNSLLAENKSLRAHLAEAQELAAHNQKCSEHNRQWAQEVQWEVERLKGDLDTMTDVAAYAAKLEARCARLAAEYRQATIEALQECFDAEHDHEAIKRVKQFLAVLKRTTLAEDQPSNPADDPTNSNREDSMTAPRSAKKQFPRLLELPYLATPTMETSVTIFVEEGGVRIDNTGPLPPKQVKRLRDWLTRYLEAINA